MTPQQAADKIMQAVGYSVEERKSRFREDVLGILGEMTGWRAIESAPKDGTYVLVYWNNRNMDVVRYLGKHGWQPHGSACAGYSHVTHWQLLPLPPQALAAKE